MRKMFVKYASVLLVLWYSLSIIGFDVHSCKSTGEVFVASLAGGVSCEDIHPEHSCKSHGGCCCHHENESCCAGHETEHADSHVAKEDCCSNDLQVLQLTGVQMSDNERFAANVHDCQPIFDVDLAMELAVPTLQKSFIKYLEHPDPGVVTPDRQAFLSIWRV
jgi:hypothetical protein